MHFYIFYPSIYLFPHLSLPMYAFSLISVFLCLHDNISNPVENSTAYLRDVHIWSSRAAVLQVLAGFPASTHPIQVNASLAIDPFHLNRVCWSRETSKRPAGQRPSRTDFGHPWLTWTNQRQLYFWPNSD